MAEPQTYQDVQDIEDRFVAASDAERLRMLADGEAPASDKVVYIALQAIARTMRGEPL